MKRSFESSNDSNLKIKLKNSIFTSTPKLKHKRPDASQPLTLSMTDLEQNNAISDLHNASEGDENQKIQEREKQISQFSNSFKSGKRKKKKVKNDEPAIHNSHNNLGNLLRNDSKSESNLRGMLFGVKALNTPLKRKKSKRNNVTNTNSFSNKKNYVKELKKSSLKKIKLMSQDSEVDAESDLSKSFAEGEMYSSSLVQDTEGNLKEKLKNDSLSSVDVHSDVSSIDVCAEQNRQLRACNDVPDNDAIKKCVKKRKSKKHKKSLVCVCSDMSDNNTCTQEEVYPEVSNSEASKNESRNQKTKHVKIKSSKKKKKSCVFPVDVSSSPKHSRTSEDIEHDPINENNGNLFDVSNGISIDNDGVVEDTHPGTAIVDDKKKKKIKVKGQHKESSSELTMDLSENDTDHCSCSVNASSASSAKQSTSSNVRSREEDTFEFPSSYDSFHLNLDSDSSRSLVQQAKTKSSVLFSPKRTFVDRNGVDYETLLQDAVMNKNYLTDHEIWKLKNLDIVCHHNVYPLHCADVPPCRPPDKRDKEILSDFEVKTGRFTEQENEILLRNWKMFCEEYKFEDPEPFINFERGSSLKKEQRRDFVQYLGKDLPDRPLYLIFKHFVYLFQHQNKGAFTKEEDAFILKTKQRNIAQPYSVLAKILKRNRQSIYKRFIMLEQSSNAGECSSSEAHDKTSSSEKREKWSKFTAELIVQSLAKIMKLNSIEDLRDAKIPNATWKKVGKHVQIPEHKLRQFWNYRLHVQLFAQSPLRESEIFQQIISWLHHQNPSSLKDIVWKDTIHLVPGSTDWFMWEMFRRLRKRYHADRFKSLQDFIQRLYEEGVNMKDILIPRYKLAEDFSLSSYI